MATGGSIWAPTGGNVLTSKLVKELALSDMVTSLIAAVNVGYYRVYAAHRVTAFYLSLLTASSSGLVTVDINDNGVSIFSTKITIDANEKDNTSAATPYVIVGSPTPTSYDFLVGHEITFDIDAAGTGAKALVAYCVGFDI